LEHNSSWLEIFYFLGEFIINNSCLNFVEVSLNDAIMLPGALLLNNAPFFLHTLKWRGGSFFYIHWRNSCDVIEDTKLTHIIRMHSNDIESLFIFFTHTVYILIQFTCSMQCSSSNIKNIVDGFMYEYVSSYDNIATHIITSSTIRKSLISWIIYIKKDQLREINKMIQNHCHIL